MILRYDEIMQGALANMVARQDKITDFNEGSIAHTIIDTVSRIAERQYVAIRQGYNEMLSLIPYAVFGFTRKEGLHAGAQVVFSREKADDTAIPIRQGVRVSGGGVTFITVEDATIPAYAKDSPPVKVKAELEGKKGNVGARVINTIESIVNDDITAVSNEQAATGGSDNESDDEMAARFKAYINGLSGTSDYAIKSAALSVNSVRSVSVVNHKPPFKNVYNVSVYVDDGTGSADDATIAQVKAIIEGDGSAENPGHLAPGINARVLAPTAVPVSVDVEATVVSIDSAEAKEEIARTISEYLNALAIGKDALVSQIMSAVLALGFVRDVRIISPVANVSVGAAQIVRSGDVLVTVKQEG